MLKRPKLFICAGMACFSVIIFYEFYPSITEAQTETVLSPVSQNVTHFISEINHIAEQNDNKIIQADVGALVETENENLSEWEKVLLADVIKFDQLKYSMNRRKARQKIITRALSEPGLFQLANNALLNLESTVDKYPQNQAQLRIFAIDLLKEKAIQGDDSYLSNALQKLSVELQSQEKWAKGRDQDLIDLLGAWIEAKGVAEVIENPKELFSYYGPKLSNVYFTAFSLYLKNGTNDGEVDKILRKFRQKNS